MADRYCGVNCDSAATARVARLVVLVLGVLLARAALRALEHVGIGHGRPAPQRQHAADEQGNDQPDDQPGLHGNVTLRIKPSCAVLATSRPSRAKMLPRVKPRAPEPLGLSVA